MSCGAASGGVIRFLSASLRKIVLFSATSFFTNFSEAASITNKVFYANPNAASLKFVKKDVAENKTIFLSDADKKRMTPPDAAPQDIKRVQTRIFTTFKAGK